MAFPLGGFRQNPANTPSSLPPSGPAGGELSGTYPNPTLAHYTNPFEYGAVGNGVADDNAALVAAIASLAVGGVLDLCGYTFYTSASLTLTTSGVTIQNGTITTVPAATPCRALNVASADVTLWNCSFTRATGTGGATNAAQQSLVSVDGARFRSINCNYTNAALACLYFGTGSADYATVRGGYFKNSSSRQNACLIYVAATVQNVGYLIDGVTAESTGCPEGILLFDVRRCKVVNCTVFGMTAVADVTPGPWTNMGGNVWRAADRTNGTTTTLLVSGVQRTQNTATPTTPGALQWGVAAGLLYVNSVGDPAATVTSRVVGGYGVTAYCTTGIVISENLIAHNLIYDCDGFGIYYQITTAGSVNNETRGNIIRNVCRTGIQDVSLPFAGISVAGGADTICEGDRIYTTGGAGAAATPGFQASSSATGRCVGMLVRSSADIGYYIQTSDWECASCRVLSAGSFGFYVPSVANVRLHGCEAISGTLAGFYVNASTNVHLLGCSALLNGTATAQFAVAGASTNVVVDGCLASHTNAGAVGYDLAGTSNIAAGFNHIGGAITAANRYAIGAGVKSAIPIVAAVLDGANLSMGVATLIAGTLVVNNTRVTATSRIMLTPQNASGLAGSVSVSARTAGTSFTILSTNVADTRDVAWLIIEPA